MPWPEAMIGLGALLDIETIVVMATLGVLLGQCLPEGTSRVDTDALERIPSCWAAQTWSR